MDFSIIIPTYNRLEPLKKCLTAINHLEYPIQKFEVIVVDDGSNPPISEGLSGFSVNFNLHCLRQKNKGPAFARNHGAEKAIGQNLVFTDDDCLIHLDYLKKAAPLLAQHPQCSIVGRTINFYKKNCYSTASQALTDYLHFFLKSPDNQTPFLVSNNFIISKELFHRIGGFNQNFHFPGSEDRELGERLVQHQYLILFEHDLKIDHAHKMNLAQFTKQHFNYGRSSVLFNKIIKKNKINPFRFYFNMLIHPFKNKNVWISFQLSFLLILSQVTYIIGHFFERFFLKKN